MVSPYAGRDLSQSGERSRGVGSERGHRHDATEVEVRRLGHGVGDSSRRAGRYAATPHLVVESYLDKAPNPTPGPFGAAVERRHEALPVDRVDDIGIRRDVAGLVGLHLTHEVQGEVLAVAQVGELLGGLLVPVLPDVGDAETSEQLDVGGREVLGHDDEGDLRAVPSGSCAGSEDPVLHRLKACGQLLAPVGHGRRTMTPAKRPVLPSRR